MPPPFNSTGIDVKSKDKAMWAHHKFGGRHTTFIEAAIPFLKAAKASLWVDKIVLGKITPCKPGHISVKFHETTSGLRAVLRGPCAVQEFYITCEQRHWAIEDLTKAVLDD